MQPQRFETTDKTEAFVAKIEELKKRYISRAECVALNKMAEEISSGISNTIREKF